jgi:large subunit ribosomal protein L21
MHYAIVELGGRQVLFANGNYYFTNRLSVEPGTIISMKRVLIAKANDQIHFGQPYVQNSSVVGEVLEHVKGPKVVSYKMKSKKKYRRKLSSKQQLTKLLIKNINI